MAKLFQAGPVRVTCCDECPLMYEPPTGWLQCGHCEANYRQIITDNSFPEWCPLPEWEEKD